MLKLSSTSALVLLWAQQECYQSKKAKDYLKQLDLAEGKILYERCKEVCPYYDEVIKNRKYGVFTLIKKCCDEKSDCQQVVIAGAGLDALGVEVTEYYPHVKVFELDKENMDLKSHLFAKLVNRAKTNITFIEIDLLNCPYLYSSLIAHSWDPKKSTLLILEGISYYLSSKSMQNLVRSIKPNWTIFEFLKPEKEISTDRLKIPREVFGHILSMCDLSDISRYNYSSVEKVFNMPFVAKYSMKRLEKMRTGSNRFFPTNNSGWIEVCLLENQ